ncbi:MAG: FimV/HubP family polar landmark protein, partial [Pontibacterium sp.]
DQLVEEVSETPSVDLPEADSLPDAGAESQAPDAESETLSADDSASLDALFAQAGDIDSLEKDLNELLSAADIDLDEAARSIDIPASAMSAEAAEEELKANIVHDLDAELDSELSALLDGDSGDDLSLDELEEDGSEDVDGWALLEGADEIETKLDLARAFMDMDDAASAQDILNEVANEGNEKQKQEATSLLRQIKS